MFWIIVIVIVALIAMWLDSVFGKIVFGSAIIALGLLLLYWITGLTVLITLAKACAVIMVVVIVAAILASII